MAESLEPYVSAMTLCVSYNTRQYKEEVAANQKHIYCNRYERGFRSQKISAEDDRYQNKAKDV